MTFPRFRLLIMLVIPTTTGIQEGNDGLPRNSDSSRRHSVAQHGFGLAAITITQHFVGDIRQGAGRKPSHLSNGNLVICPAFSGMDRRDKQCSGFVHISFKAKDVGLLV